ncbi:hypothetical protein Droror1_Dr00012919 [Drosera rotundifolia]
MGQEAQTHHFRNTNNPIIQNIDKAYYNSRQQRKIPTDSNCGDLISATMLTAATPPPAATCSQNHRASLLLHTNQGGSICLHCFTNLISNPNSPSFYVSYALSQFSLAISDPSFLNDLIKFHVHVVVAPLVSALEAYDDEAIARQVVEVVVGVCGAGGEEVLGEFVGRVAEVVSEGGLAWSRRQVHTLHCLGVLLDCENFNPYGFIKDKYGLINNLVVGLQLPSEVIQGEILFVLYRISVLQCTSRDDEGADLLSDNCTKLLHLALEALMKTQSNDVHLNCVALLKVLAQRGLLENVFSSELIMMDTCEADNFMQMTDDANSSFSLSRLLAEAIKAPLLSPDTEVQIATLDFIFHCLSWEGFSSKQIRVLVEENIVDYIFEILRLSKKIDQVVSSCLRVLHLFSTAEEVFRQRLAVGFTTLVSALSHVAEVPFHPAQFQMLELILDAVSNCPGIVSTKHVEEIGSALTVMLQKHLGGEVGLLSEAVIFVCSIFVGLMKCPSSNGTSKLLDLAKEASKLAVSASLSMHKKDPSQFLQSLYLSKETYVFTREMNNNELGDNESPTWVMELCQRNILPWFVTTINEMEEESILGVLETFHFIFSETCDTRSLEFVKTLLSQSWFSLLFRCLGLYPTEKMKLRTYFMFSSMVDCLLGNGSGQPIRHAASSLPSDPLDMLYLLGQKSINNQELSSCQTAVLRMLHVSSLHNEMIADKKLVLASLEQYILVNRAELLYGSPGSMTNIEFVNLYGLYRSLANHMSYSPEAEKLFFHTLFEKNFDLFSAELHPTSLKWLFQQERICDLLSCQILNFCRNNCSIWTPNIDHQINFQYVKDISELVAMGDNYAPKVLVTLLKQLSEEEFLADDFVFVFNLLSAMVSILPAASDQLCMNGLGNALRNLCYRLTRYSSSENYVIIPRFIFIILSCVQPETLTDDEVWLAITMKLLDTCGLSIAETEWTETGLLVVGVLSLILHYSSHHALVETTKFIVLNSSLACSIGSTIAAVRGKVTSSACLDENTDTGKALVLLLILYYFYLRSVEAVLPGTMDWKSLLNQSDSVSPSLSMGITCRDLCWLMYLGSSLVKLVAAYCIQELFAQIGDHRNKEGGLNCSIECLRSLVAVLEGHVFDSDVRVAINCGISLSTIWSWEVSGMSGKRILCADKWCRMIVEELVMYLVTPCSLSKSFVMHHKPAAHVAAAALGSSSPPGWMTSVFDEASISGMIKCLSADNLTSEIVLLFRQLLRSGFLNPDQISSLNHVFQVCRKELYNADRREASSTMPRRKAISMSVDLGEVSEFLLHLVSSESPVHASSGRTQAEKGQLSGEIELFFMSLAHDRDVHNS